MEKISSPKKIEIQYTARKSSQWLSVDITDEQIGKIANVG